MSEEEMKIKEIPCTGAETCPFCLLMSSTLGFEPWWSNMMRIGYWDDPKNAYAQGAD